MPSSSWIVAFDANTSKKRGTIDRCTSGRRAALSRSSVSSYEDCENARITQSISSVSTSRGSSDGRPRIGVSPPAGLALVDEADELEAVLRVRADLALDDLADLTGPDDQRAARVHDGREHEAPDRASRQQHEWERGGQEHRRLDREVDLGAHHAAQNLACDQEQQRACEEGVKQLADLVERGQRDAAVLALVEVVDGEDRDPDRQRQGGERHRQPRRRDHRGRCDRLGDPVRDREGGRYREGVGGDEEPGSTVRQCAAALRTRCRQSAGRDGLGRDGDPE